MCTNSRDTSLRKLREVVKDREAWIAAVHGVTESDMTEQLNNSSVNVQLSGFLPPKQARDNVQGSMNTDG